MIITHYCDGCGHIELHHEFGQCMIGWCPCRTMQRGASKLIKTYDDNGKVIARLIMPGEVVRQMGTACDCEDCQALYLASLGGI